MRDRFNNTRCDWCNDHVPHGSGTRQGSDVICDPCIDEVHGAAAWDRVDP